MIVATKIELKDYARLIFFLSYKQPFVLIITAIGVLSLVLAPLYFFGVQLYDQPPYLALGFGLYIILVTPLAIYRNTKKNFKSNQRIHERIVYEVTPDFLKITGETFSSALQWPTTYKILETRDFFMIYGSRQVANLIPKKSMTVDEVTELREILRKLDSVKNKKLLA